jgi:hypothetical protein
MGDTSGDLDAGVMATIGRVRLGLTARNLRTPEFSEGEERLDLSRQVRTGVSFRAGSAPGAELVVAVDTDLTTSHTAFGDLRHLAAGVETWVANRSVGVRAGIGMNTIGEPRRSGSVGASLAVRSGLYIDAQLTRGKDEARNGWGFALRVGF